MKERISETLAIASMHETSLHSFETDSADLSFPNKPTSLARAMGLSCLSPKAKKKKEVSKQCVCSTITKVEPCRLPNVAFEYNVWNF